MARGLFGRRATFAELCSASPGNRHHHDCHQRHSHQHHDCRQQRQSQRHLQGCVPLHLGVINIITVIRITVIIHHHHHHNCHHRHHQCHLSSLTVVTKSSSSRPGPGTVENSKLKATPLGGKSAPGSRIRAAWSEEIQFFMLAVWDF